MGPKRASRKTALIVGVTGQDGSYLAELLLAKKYRVYGMTRQTSHDAHERIEHLRDRLRFVQGDLADQSSLDRAIADVRPDEVYNLAAQSFVPASWSQPVITGDITAIGVARLLEALRKHKPDARFYQASSSEMFGKVSEAPQSETTPFYPRSPYGVAKVYGHGLTVNYRESFGMFACSGICFNHESPRRGLAYVTRKVCRRAAEIKLGLARELRVGNIDARRDWGFAGDYVDAMWRMLQQDVPSDFVISTGRRHSVEDLIRLAFKTVGLNWKDHVVVDSALLRPIQEDTLVGDSSKAARVLGWKPTVDFQALVAMMVESDLAALKRRR